MSPINSSKSTWYIYLLYCPKHRRTYVGSTTNPARRLRQHNGEIRGGARATRGKTWGLVVTIGGFQTRSEACRWEKLVKMRARGLRDRLAAALGLVLGICPPGKRAYPVPRNLYVGERECNSIKNT